MISITDFNYFICEWREDCIPLTVINYNAIRMHIVLHRHHGFAITINILRYGCNLIKQLLFGFCKVQRVKAIRTNKALLHGFEQSILYRMNTDVIQNIHIQ